MTAKITLTLTLALFITTFTATAHAQGPLPPRAVTTAYQDSTLHVTWATDPAGPHHTVFTSHSSAGCPSASHDSCSILARTNSPPFQLPLTGRAPAHVFVSSCNAAGDCSQPSRAAAVSSHPTFPSHPAPSWHAQSGAAQIQWPPAAGAARYVLQHTTFGSATCSTGHCRTAAQTPATSHTQPLTPSRKPGTGDHFWISACNAHSCSPPKQVPFQDLRPPHPPSPLTAAFAQDKVSLSWPSVQNADTYTVLHSSKTPLCTPGPDGRPQPCNPIDTTSDLAHVHPDPHPSRNRYWIIACNSAGCTAPSGPGTAPAAKNASQGSPRQPTGTDKSPTPPEASFTLTPATAHTGQPVLASLSHTNHGPEPITALLSIESPHGWSASHHQLGGTCSPAECHTRTTLAAGQSAQLTATYTPSNPGRATILAKVSILSDKTTSSRILTASANILRATQPHAAPRNEHSQTPPQSFPTSRWLIPLLLTLAAGAVTTAALLSPRTKR